MGRAKSTPNFDEYSELITSSSFSVVSVMIDKNKDRLTGLVELNNNFSGAFKLVEQLVDEIDFTTVNDIPYALRANMDLLSAILLTIVNVIEDYLSSLEECVNTLLAGRFIISSRL